MLARERSSTKKSCIYSTKATQALRYWSMNELRLSSRGRILISNEKFSIRSSTRRPIQFTVRVSLLCSFSLVLFFVGVFAQPIPPSAPEHSGVRKQKIKTSSQGQAWLWDVKQLIHFRVYLCRIIERACVRCCCVIVNSFNFSYSWSFVWHWVKSFYPFCMYAARI